ncbi:MAG: hypothetical protein LBQ15_10470 [Clostridium sp.]|jgi:hypothetical protein|nr:hypothetical protein [Clostridium sp.]
MTSLLEFREICKRIYSKNEVFMIPVMKFFLAFLALHIVNDRLGYMSRLDSLPIVLMVSLLSSFLPNGCILLFAALFSLLHLYALSLEAALVGLCLYLVMFLLFFRFAPKNLLAVLLMPLLFVMKVPYVMPIVMGLIGSPAAAVSVACGVVIYYFLESVAAQAPVIGEMGTEEAAAKLRLLIDGLLDNKTMLVVIAAFSITIIAVYLIRRMAVAHSWTLAMVAGAILNLVILLVGDLLYDTNTSLPVALLGSFLALLAAKVLEFFRFCVDYSRTEKVQFEDDEYYYYVKAVPKMMVAAQTKTVKKINPSRSLAAASAGERGRSVMTENLSARGSAARSGRKGAGGKSVTIVHGRQDNGPDDYEGLD